MGSQVYKLSLKQLQNNHGAVKIVLTSHDKLFLWTQVLMNTETERFSSIFFSFLIFQKQLQAEGSRESD